MSWVGIAYSELLLGLVVVIFEPTCRSGWGSQGKDGGFGIVLGQAIEPGGRGRRAPPGGRGRPGPSSENTEEGSGRDHLFSSSLILICLFCQARPAEASAVLSASDPG